MIKLPIRVKIFHMKIRVSILIFVIIKQNVELRIVAGKSGYFVRRHEESCLNCAPVTDNRNDDDND